MKTHLVNFNFWSGQDNSIILFIELLISVFWFELISYIYFSYSNFLLPNLSSVVSGCLYWDCGASEISLSTGPVQFNPNAGEWSETKGCCKHLYLRNSCICLKLEIRIEPIVISFFLPSLEQMLAICRTLSPFRILGVREMGKCSF